MADVRSLADESGGREGTKRTGQQNQLWVKKREGKGEKRKGGPPIGREEDEGRTEGRRGRKTPTDDEVESRS